MPPDPFEKYADIYDNFMSIYVNLKVSEEQVRLNYDKNFFGVKHVSDEHKQRFFEDAKSAVHHRLDMLELLSTCEIPNDEINTIEGHNIINQILGYQSPYHPDNVDSTLNEWIGRASDDKYTYKLHIADEITLSDLGHSSGNQTAFGDIMSSLKALKAGEILEPARQYQLDEFFSVLGSNIELRTMQEYQAEYREAKQQQRLESLIGKFENSNAVIDFSFNKDGEDPGHSGKLFDQFTYKCDGAISTEHSEYTGGIRIDAAEDDAYDVVISLERQTDGTYLYKWSDPLDREGEEYVSARKAMDIFRHYTEPASVYPEMFEVNMEGKPAPHVDFQGFVNTVLEVNSDLLNQYDTKQTEPVKNAQQVPKH